MLVSFVLLALELVISFVSPLIMSVTIDSVLDGKPLSAPWFFSWLIGALGGLDTIRENIWIMAAAMLSLQLLLAPSGTRGPVQQRRRRGRREAAAGHALRPHTAPAVCLACRRQTGDVIQRATNDMETVRRFYNPMKLELIRTVVMLFVAFSSCSP
jgi:ATP-binding cassette subfamily B protein